MWEKVPRQANFIGCGYFSHIQDVIRNATTSVRRGMQAVDRPQPLPPAALLRAVRRLLRPLVRLMMGGGITFPIVADLLRGLFVEVAATELLADTRARTDSRI